MDPGRASPSRAHAASEGLIADMPTNPKCTVLQRNPDPGIYPSAFGTKWPQVQILSPDQCHRPLMRCRSGASSAPM